ncbi:hypothetical protein E2542_SST07328 [Spatholobus suberectus]|nr:hypothetical protein E2542_SST07328 [Spatholobus suberectus]
MPVSPDSFVFPQFDWKKQAIELPITSRESSKNNREENRGGGGSYSLLSELSSLWNVVFDWRQAHSFCQSKCYLQKPQWSCELL